MHNNFKNQGLTKVSKVLSLNKNVSPVVGFNGILQHMLSVEHIHIECLNAFHIHKEHDSNV